MKDLAQHPLGDVRPRCMHGCGNRYKAPLVGMLHAHQCVFLYEHRGDCLFSCEAETFETLVAQVQSLSDALNTECMKNDDLWAEVLKVPEETPVIIQRRGLRKGGDLNGWNNAVYQITKALKATRRKLAHA